jgi:predicted DNA-binding protein (UPF0251 family)
MTSVLSELRSQPNGTSVPLTKEEFATLRSFRRKCKSDVECSKALGIPRSTLVRILLVGSGSPENIEKIRAALGQ